MVNTIKQIISIIKILVSNKSEKFYFLLIFFFMTIGAILELIGIGILLPFMSLVLENKEMNVFNLNFFDSFNSFESPILIATIFVISFFLFKNIFLAFNYLLIGKFTYSIHSKVSKTLYSNYLNQPFSFHLNTNSSILIRNAINETTQLVLGVLSPLLTFSSQVLITLALTSLLIYVEPIGFLTSILIFSVSSYIFTRILKKSSYKWGNIRHHYEGLRIKELHHGLFGIKELKVLNREQEFTKRYQSFVKQSENAGVYLFSVSNLPKLFLETIIIIIVCSLILFYEYFFTSSNFFGIISLAILVSVRLLPVFSLMINSLNSINFNKKAIEALSNDLKINIGNKKKINSKLRFNKMIKISNLKFSYENKNIFKNLFIEIKKNEFLAIIGKSGSGKTTLINILLGLLQPDSYECIIDDIKSIDIQDLKKVCAYVPQDIFLLDASIKENITYYQEEENFDIEKFDKSIEIAQLSEFINSLKFGLDTLVGEKGIRISGGQRQRIGIARALYHDSSILIMDEASNSLDPKTEENFLKLVRDLSKKLTIIFISHNEIIRKYADRILYLKNGNLEDIKKVNE